MEGTKIKVPKRKQARIEIIPLIDVIFFLLATRFLERNAREKSIEAAENLLRLVPAMATRVGADTEAVLRAAGLSADEIATLAAQGAVQP